MLFFCNRGSAEKALKVVKALLKVEEPKTDEGYFHRVDTEEETRIYSDLYTLSRVSTYNNYTLFLYVSSKYICN